MKIFNKHITTFLLSAVILTVTAVTIGCSSNSKASDREENLEAKKNMQGTWVNELEDNIVFSVKNDTIYFNDSLSEPAYFHIYQDTLYLNYHKVIKYPIKKLTASSFIFVNDSGDEVELIKSNVTTAELKPSGANEQASLNQGVVIKHDSVMTFDGKRLHAYKKVNPTTRKVYQQTKNSEGLNIENIYLDNIVYIAVYDGGRKIFGQNIEKIEFKGTVPDSYLEQAILSDVVIDGFDKNGVRFVAILSVPNSSTNYKINIFVSPTGKKTLSL